MVIPFSQKALPLYEGVGSISRIFKIYEFRLEFVDTTTAMSLIHEIEFDCEPNPFAKISCLDGSIDLGFEHILAQSFAIW